jgi:hypothetical protein
MNWVVRHFLQIAAEKTSDSATFNDQSENTGSALDNDYFT